jgi:hypothetical protein
MGKAIQVKCHNKDAHKRSGGEGDLLAFLEGNSIYLYCRDRVCKRWTKIEINFPGIRIDFSKAGIVQRLMPKNYNFDYLKATVVLDDGFQTRGVKNGNSGNDQ